MRPLGRVLETVLYVDDLDVASRFYADVLGLEQDSAQAGLFSFFKIGQAMLLLFDPKASATDRGSIPPHGAHGRGHACFAVAASELAPWRDRLESSGVAIEAVHDWPRGGRSIYFRDPAGNSLELATPLIWGLPDLPADEARR
jgi:catechol 2,3-dioxygenase-like lactoylglutathione lyase family enzyme